MELACNIHAYMKQDTIDNKEEYSYKSVEYILQVFISDNALGTDMERSLKAEIIVGAKNGRDTLIFQLLVTSNFCKKAISSIYPEAQNPGVNRRVTNQIFFPSGQIYYPENLDGMINILWTHTSDTNLQGWKPNHFLPCFPRILLCSKEIPPQTEIVQKMNGNLKLKHNLEMTHSLKTMEEKNRQQRSNIWKLSMTLIAKYLRNWT